MNPNQTPNPMPMQTPPQMPTPAPTPRPVAPTPAPQIPITPKPPMSTPMKSSGSNSGAKALFWIIAVIIVLAAVYFLLKRPGGMMSGQQASFSTQNVQVSNTSAGKIPAGFPASIPVELANVSDSSTLTYPEHNTTLYSVTYMSAHPAEELYAEYTTYLKQNNYAVQTLKLIKQITIEAISSKGRLLTIITPQTTGGAEVQLAYTVTTSS